MKIKFVDESELVITEFNDPIDVVKTYNTIAAVGAEFTKFDPANCATLLVYDDDDVMFAQFDGMFFGGVRVENIVTDNGVAFEAHFTFRQKTQMEIMQEQIAALQESQNLQDGAIEDIASEVFG